MDEACKKDFGAYEIPEGVSISKDPATGRFAIRAVFTLGNLELFAAKTALEEIIEFEHRIKTL